MRHREREKEREREIKKERDRERERVRKKKEIGGQVQLMVKGSSNRTLPRFYDPILGYIGSVMLMFLKSNKR